MNREHLHTKLIRGFDRSRDGVRNVIKLEIEPDFCTGGQNRAYSFRSLGRVKLEADFEEGDFPAELLNEFERLFLRRDVECDDDFVVCHSERSPDISVFRPPARDSSTSLGMTEQIAGYASPRACEDQFITENSRPAQRRVS